MTSAVVTGSNGGIGSATVSAFEDAGFTVSGLDVDDDAAAIFGGLDRLDVLVCAHGISGRKLGDGPVDTCTEEAWDAVLDANLRSVFVYRKHAVPLLRNAGGGAIVTVASVLKVGGDDDFATHARCLPSRIGLTRAMAVTAKDGIRCNVVPWPIETALSKRARRPNPRSAPRAAAAHRRTQTEGCHAGSALSLHCPVRHRRRPDGRWLDRTVKRLLATATVAATPAAASLAVAPTSVLGAPGADAHVLRGPDEAGVPC